jgi:hypothetical protein
MTAKEQRAVRAVQRLLGLRVRTACLELGTKLKRGVL